MEEGRDYPPEEFEAMFASQEGSNRNEEVEQGEEEEEAGGSKPSGKVSYVWKYYEKVPVPNKPRHFRCVCTVCCDIKKIMKSYAWSIGTGFGSMSRHLRNDHGITASGVGSQTQTQLSGFMSEQSGGGKPFFYSQKNMIDHMATFVNLEELPFTYGESVNVENFNRLALQPSYSHVNRHTLKDRTMAQYKEQKKELIAYFANFDGRVALTSDTWTSKQNNPFMCVTVHWIDNDFFLQKRIIAFDIMEEKHTGYNIYLRLKKTLDKFNLTKKLFSISFDNASANTKCIDYVLQMDDLLLNGDLVHVRCCAHIINLSAQEGLAFLAPLLEPIKTCINWTRNARSMKTQWKTLCDKHGLRNKQWGTDCATRWNSTYKLIKQALRYKNVLTEFYNSHQRDEDAMIDNSMWTIAANVCNLLKPYYNATNVFSLVYEPNVHLVILECLKIVIAFKTAENVEPCLIPIVDDMKTKWVKYFTSFPYIYGVASLLDPCVKQIGLTNSLLFYYEMLNIIDFDVEIYVQKCIDVLRELCKIYAKDKGESSSSSSVTTKSARFDDQLHSILFRRTQSSSSSTSTLATKELDDYLTHGVDTNDTDFNILLWWKARSIQFPLLSKIARDVLVVPASTVASESAFSAGGRVLDDKRSRLAPPTVKMCVCKRDWDLAKIRRQGAKEFDPLEADEIVATDASSGN
ncbi:hypothetical protein KSS87_008209 [Heliosperma pusillum]|nr:hypothetical protein KSS87_008209 [Heliosperma pusillum]